jgi:hypothetical protein
MSRVTTPIGVHKVAPAGLFAYVIPVTLPFIGLTVIGLIETVTDR